jgi:hypothetical protein
MDYWALYMAFAVGGLIGGGVVIPLALYKGWDTFKLYTVADIIWGVLGAYALCAVIAFTWPLSLPGLILWSTYLRITSGSR